MRTLSYKESAFINGGATFQHCIGEASGIAMGVCIFPFALLMSAFAGDAPNSGRMPEAVFYTIEKAAMGTGKIIGSGIGATIDYVVASNNHSSSLV